MFNFKKSLVKKCVAFSWILSLIAAFQMWKGYVIPQRNINGVNLVSHINLEKMTVLGSNASIVCQLNWTELALWKPSFSISKENQMLYSSGSSYTHTEHGLWIPTECDAQTTLGIVVPYRDRKEHLDILLFNLHSMLQLQKVAYGIYVVEEVAKRKLNRGSLRNIGFTVALKQHQFNCFVFHDVDLIPQNATHLYRCRKQPSHLSSAVDSFNYRVPYKEIFGGVVAVTKTQLESINGYSNRFFLWGGEDDDIYSRLYAGGWRPVRSSMTTGRYSMLHHEKSHKNPFRFLLGWYDIKKELWQQDGLNNLHYTVINKKRYPTYDWTLVDIDDSKADVFIEEALKEIRQSLPPRYRNLNNSQIAEAVKQLKQYYRGPYQVLKVIEDGVKAVNPF